MGKIEVITGPMFSGKTSELLRRLERRIIAKQEYVFIKPSTDTRKQTVKIRNPRNDSYTYLQVSTINAVNSFDSLSKMTLYYAAVIAIDEAQFFNENILEFVVKMRSEGKTVLISGLDMDINQEPFGYMPGLMAIADTVTKLTAICSCGADAAFTQKIKPDSKLIDIGDSEKYIPCCWECYSRRRAIA